MLTGLEYSWRSIHYPLDCVLFDVLCMGEDNQLSQQPQSKYLKPQNNPDGSNLYLHTAQTNRSSVRPVDNDRDGYTNLEGDCDDGDPAVAPELWTEECPAPEPCGGCAGTPARGLGPWAFLALVLTVRRQRRA